MGRYRKKPVVVEAAKWHQHGDDPNVCRWERPSREGSEHCGRCDKTMDSHGWVKTLEGGHIVCPGDVIITGVRGEHYPCKPDIFQATYEPV